MGYIFGAGTGKTQADLERERLLVDALLGPKPAPRNLGEGLSALGEAIGSRLAMRRLASDTTATNDAGSALFKTLFGGTQAAQTDQPPTYATDTTVQPAAAPGFADKFLSKVQPAMPSVNAELGYDPNTPAQPPSVGDPAIDPTQAQPIPQPMPQPQQVAQAAPDLQRLMGIIQDPRFAQMQPMQQEIVRKQLEQAILKQQQASDPAYQLGLKKDQAIIDHYNKMGGAGGGTPPSGYRFTKDGNLEAITGGPADPAIKGTNDEEVVKNVAAGIVNGDQPPTTTGLYRYGAKVRSELEKNGFNLSHANLDWLATSASIKNLNSNQQNRLRQSVGMAIDLMPSIENLAQQWDAGKYPWLNQKERELAKAGLMEGKYPGIQSIATQLDSQIATLTADLGAAYMGGNSPTDHSLELAAKALNSDWSKQVLLDNIKLAKANLAIRRNSLSLPPAGIDGGVNPYLPPAATQDQSAPSAAPAASNGIPDGWSPEEWQMLSDEEKAQVLGQ